MQYNQQPHKNVEFGLKLRKLTPADARKKAEEYGFIYWRI
jgi:hypothetical protein